MKFIPTTALSLALLATALPCQAGVYTDDMSKCLVSSTSEADRTLLVRWIFATSALHPEVASIASVTPEQRSSMSQATGKLFEKLITVTCRKQTRDALKNEGALAMQQSFQVLGQVAMRSLMSHPAVTQGFEGMNKYVDEKKIQELTK